MTQRFAIYGNRDVDVPTVLHPDLEYPELVRGLVGAWSPCLGNTGGKLLDYSGRGNHGTLTNMVPATDWLVKDGRLALDFDGGTSEYVTAGTGVAIANKSFSILVWCKRDTTGLDVVVSHGSFGTQTNYNDLSFGYFTDNKLFISFWGSDLYSTSTFTDTNTNLIAITYDANSNDMRLFRNGVQVAQGTTVEDFQGTESFIIGAYRLDSHVSFDGTIFDVKVHERVVGVNEMALLYSLGPGGWAIPRQRRWNAMSAAQLAQAAYVVGGGIAVPGGVN